MSAARISYRETATSATDPCSQPTWPYYNFVGDAFRGAIRLQRWRCGWGEVNNGGFGLVLDGSKESSTRLQQMLGWDVNGIAREHGHATPVLNLRFEMPWNGINCCM